MPLLNSGQFMRPRPAPPGPGRRSAGAAAALCSESFSRPGAAALPAPRGRLLAVIFFISVPAVDGFGGLSYNKAQNSIGLPILHQPGAQNFPSGFDSSKGRGPSATAVRRAFRLPPTPPPSAARPRNSPARPSPPYFTTRATPVR